MNKNYKKDEHILKGLIRGHTKTKINTTLQLNIFYKYKKYKVNCPAGERQ